MYSNLLKVTQVYSPPPPCVLLPPPLGVNETTCVRLPASRARPYLYVEIDCIQFPSFSFFRFFFLLFLLLLLLLGWGEVGRGDGGREQLAKWLPRCVRGGAPRGSPEVAAPPAPRRTEALTQFWTAVFKTVFSVCCSLCVSLCFFTLCFSLCFLTVFDSGRGDGANFGGLVLGCIITKFCKEIFKSLHFPHIFLKLYSNIFKYLQISSNILKYLQIY